MVADHATLRRAAVHEVTAGAFAVVSVEFQVKVFMPPIVADPEISFLRRCAYMKRHEERAAEQRDERATRSILYRPIARGRIRTQERIRAGLQLFTPPALKSAGITWDEQELDKYLANPPADVHGTKMVISVPNAEDRQNVIAYLKTLK
jgi:hypothetical protein